MSIARWNLKEAGGKKLQASYYTRLSTLSVPLADGEVATDVSSTNLYLLNGNDYVGNFEYVFSNDLGDYQHDLDKIYNDEGYVQGLANPQYYYFRHDHLGDNREVWLANTNTVAQRTQYYPSGLPWAYDRTVDHPDLQHPKYNGKEFVEMHGYDMYDFDHRGFYPAGNFFTTRDWKAEETPDVSPYSYACDNPIRYRDENGDGAGDFVKGFCAAILDDANIFSPRNIVSESIPRDNENHYSAGQTLGHATAILIGGVETIEGGGTAAAGGVITVGSGGTTSIITVPVTLVGAAEATHGTLMGLKAIGNLDKATKEPNGNSKSSTKAQHNYDIKDTKTGNVVKTGTSGGKETKNGQSYRGNSQANKWNKQEGTPGRYKSEITNRISGGKGAREKALQYEKDRANKVREQLDPRKHQRP